MQALIDYQYLSWLQFSIIAFVASILFLIMNRFHLFDRHSDENGIGYRMIMYLLIVILTVAFILVSPFYHFLFLVVAFGMFFKSIISYSRSLFSLYYSNVKFGDHIKIGDVTGKLVNMNFGGLHLLTSDNRVYFPFNMWEESKIVLESESGKVLISFECEDIGGRDEQTSIQHLEKNLFNYPYLAVSDISINKEADVFKVAARISDIKYKSGLLNHIDKAGFRLNDNII